MAVSLLRSSPPQVGGCAERGLLSFTRLLCHGSAGLPEEPVHPAAAGGLRVCGQRPHHQLHSALHVCPLAHQQAALPQNQLPALLLALEP